MSILSDRLYAVSEMVTPSLAVADVGCDHAYLSIYLIQNGIAPFVVATDVNRGPVDIARQNISRAGLTEKISCRLGNGLASVQPGEVQSVVIAGMGGRLMARIISEGADVLQQVSEIVLEPQSEVSFLRHFLEEEGYNIISEDMIFEDGKFYPVMKAVHGQMCWEHEIFYRYGKILLREKNPVLHQFLIKERDTYEKLIEELEKNGESEEACVRLEEVRVNLDMCRKAISMLDEAGLFEIDRVIKG